MTALDQAMTIESSSHRQGSVGAALESLRAVLLLDGGVCPNPLTLCLQRSVLDLPVDPNRSVVQLWVERVDQLRRGLGLELLPLRIRTGSVHRGPRRSGLKQGLRVLLENDPVRFRGTAGVLRDVAADYEDDDVLLAVAGGQISLCPLEGIVATMTKAGGDLTMLANPDGSPVELILFRAGTMREVSPKGYIDLKEQALPRIASKHRVMVASLPRPAAAPIRSRRDYVSALGQYHRAKRASWLDPEERQCFSSFAICEPGSHVADSAVLHDSVILDGGVVEAGAVVVRSVVCPGGCVRSGQTIVDATVCPRGVALS